MNEAAKGQDAAMAQAATTGATLWARLKGLGLWAGKPAWQIASERAYTAAVQQARQPALYTDLGVADTVDGRYDLCVLHVFLVIDRVRSNRENKQARDPLSQGIMDAMISDWDQNLRQLGVSDISVGKRIKTMTRALYGRLRAYDAAFEEGPVALSAAMARNVYRGAPEHADQPDGLARYALAQRHHLARQSRDTIWDHGPDFLAVADALAREGQR